MIRLALLLALLIEGCADPLAPCNPPAAVPMLDAQGRPVVTATIQVCPAPN